MENPSRKTVSCLVAGLCWALVTSCGAEDERGAGDVRGQASSPSPLETLLVNFEAAADGDPDRIALLVGIGDYSESGLPDLDGSRNDVELMRRLLTERFRYDEKDMFVLLDAEATHENIVRAFDRVLLRRARAGTQVFVYFSGHGSRILDMSGSLSAEPDALDSSFVAFDSRAGGRRGERDFSDDELRSLLVALTDKTDSVMVVTDSCHSGDLVRGGPARAVADGVIGLDLDWVNMIWPEGVRLSDDGPAELLDDRRYVHIAASRRDQSAREVRAEVDGEERSFGALTYYLVRELENAPADATWSHVVDVVAPRVRRAAHQSVTFSGDTERNVFEAGFAPARGYRAQVTSNSEQLRVSAGFLLGLRDESVLDVYDVRGETLLGSAVVENVFPDVAIAHWEKRPDDETHVAFRVRESKRGSAEPPMRILKSGAESLAEVSLVKLVEESEQPDYRVVGSGTSAKIETWDGISIGPVKRDSVEKEITFGGLRELAATRGQFKIRVELRPPTETELASLSSKNGSSLVAAPILERDSRSAVVAGTLQEADSIHIVMFDVKNESSETLFVYLLSLEESRERNLIKADDGEPVFALRSGESKSVPAQIIARKSWSAPRPMLDRYLALAFKRKLKFPKSLESRQNQTRGQMDDLPGVLARLVTGPLVRGGDRVSLSPKDWGVNYLDILVVPPGSTGGAR